jgi:steroid 5-alpha reductase family enzyme
LFFEAVGDLQLTRFRGDASNRGAVLDTGLWRYTRHPNYFGDACVWTGLFLVAASAWPGVLTILSPAVMVWNLYAGTGKKLLEKDIGDRRPAYADYARRTSGFFPWPPRPAVPTQGRTGQPTAGQD